MKTIATILMALHCVLYVAPAAAKTRALRAAEAKQVEDNYNKIAGEGQTWQLQKDQAFEVKLNSGKLKSVLFAPFADNTVQFALLSPNGQSIVQTLPKSDLAVVNIFSFSKVTAVSFKDMNGDGTKDILVMTTYFDSRPAQGEGVGGGTVNVAYAFISKNDEFKLNNDCGEDVANIKALEKCLQGKIKN